MSPCSKCASVVGWRMNVLDSCKSATMPTRISQNPILAPRRLSLHSCLDRIPRHVFGVNLFPCPLDHSLLYSPRNHDNAIFINHDQITRRKSHSINLHRHIDIDNPLAVLTVVGTGSSGKDSESHLAHLSNVTHRSIHDRTDASAVARCSRKQLSPNSRSHRSS